jgi:hypothetical protein
MLPLGRRVQDKLEALIDKHMSKLCKTSQNSKILLRVDSMQPLQNLHYHPSHPRNFGLEAVVLEIVLK